MLALLTDLNAWAALLTLTALEILLGIDNVDEQHGGLTHQIIWLQAPDIYGYFQRC
jgi:hypothetical protein